MQEGNSIEVRDVVKSFRVYLDKGSTLKEKLLFSKRRAYEDRKVLKGISFEIKKGEAVGLIGHNGCGKSTTLKLLTKIMYPDSGTIEMKGRVSSLIELGAGFHPDMSGRENIYINAAIFGLNRKQINERLDDIIAFSELEEFIDNPVRTYSSGMYMRLAFSVAINVNADILLIDEILAVGDANFQTKCFDKLREIKAQGTTIVIVSHDSSTIEKFCNRAIWINEGEIVKQGKSSEVIDSYMTFMNGKKIEIIKKEEERQRRLEEERRKYTEQEEKEKKSLKTLKTKEEEEEEAKRLQMDYTQNHFGLMNAEIEHVKIINHKEEETTVLNAGEGFEIQLFYRVDDPGIEYVFGMGIFNLEGACLYGNNTQIDHLEVKNKGVNGVVKFKADKLMLLSGKYILNVSIVDQNGTPMDFYRNYCTLEVVSADRSPGYFTIEHQWEV